MNLNELSIVEIRGALIGMIFGDGHLYEVGRFQTTSIYEDYVKFKGSILSQLTAVRYTTEENRNSSYGKNPLFRVDTLQHPVLRKLRLHTYYEGKKQATRFALSLLSPLGLLLWYLDDGCLDDAGQGIRFQLHSNCFGEAEHELIVKILNDRFCLRFNIRTVYKKLRGKTYYWLYLKAIDRLVFWDLVFKPFIKDIPESMKYKIPRREDIESKMLSKGHKRFYENIV